jgi:arginine utilization protein RocB
MNDLLKLNKLRRQIEHAKFARNMANNNNQRQVMNNRMRALIRRTHPLEERIFVLSPASVERIKRLRHVVAVQRTAKKTIQKRRQNSARARAVMHRARIVGAHHTFTPVQLLHYSGLTLPRIRRVGTILPKTNHTTRSVTSLMRHLTR